MTPSSLPMAASVRAVKASDGSDVWTSTVQAESLLPVAVQGSQLFVKSTTALHALDLATGKEALELCRQKFHIFPCNRR